MAVAWAPTVVHPQLAARQRLVLTTGAAEPAPVVDRAGVPLLAATPVVSVLLDRLQTGDLPAVTGSLAAALSPIEPSITAQTITDGAAPPRTAAPTPSRCCATRTTGR